MSATSTRWILSDWSGYRGDGARFGWIEELVEMVEAEDVRSTHNGLGACANLD